MKMQTSHLHYKLKEQKLLCKVSPKKEENMRIAMRNQPTKQKRMAKKWQSHIERKNSPDKASKNYRAFWGEKGSV